MKLIIPLLLALFLLQGLSAQTTEDLKWPREIESEGYTITLYQSQLESLEKNILKGRMALSVKNPDEELVFGALWFRATLQTDTENRTAILQKLDIAEIRFPDVENESQFEKLRKIIIEDIESLNLKMSMDRILADLEEVESARVLSDQLNNTPPEIYFRTTATVLVNIDGDPILKESENKKIKTVVNTPFFITQKKDIYYLKGGKYWFSTKDLLNGPWKETSKVPNSVEKLGDEKVHTSNDESNYELEDVIPDILVTTVPAELITTNGKVSYQPVSNTALLYVQNSENDILLEIDSQMHYVLINGRWYRSKSLNDGTWSFVEPEKLPTDFKNIPEDADIASVRVSVPGTQESQEALYEQQMPQTATVDRKTANTKVEYDGNPQFEKIEGTNLKYAINTQSTVIQLDQSYYCVDNGVWFVSSKPTGPWKVSDERPEEVDKIPPSSPVYNVKYVYIYDSTPDVVYVGYTPGYYHSYYYGGVVVYGTGFYYPPWYGAYYYPRPVTYGFGVHYNPYTGWGFTVGFSYGWFAAPMYGHPYWGPCGYHHGYRHGYRMGYYHGYHHAMHHHHRNHYHYRRNVYRTQNTGVRPNQPRRNSGAGTTGRSTTGVRTGGATTVRPAQRPNNVYTDRNGNVYERDRDGNWKQMNKRQSTRPSATTRSPSTQPAQRPSTRPSTGTTPNQSLERDYQNRVRGSSNYQNYRSYRNAAPSVPQTRSVGPRRR